MKESYQKGNKDIKPSIRSYSAVLNACAYTATTSQQTTISNKDKATTFKIARRCFKEILSGHHGQPNSMSFSQFILSCLTLVGPGTKRDQLIASVFEECCKQGLVDIKIVLEIRRSSPVLRKQLLERGGGANLVGGVIKMEDIPMEWRRNVHLNR